MLRIYALVFSFYFVEGAYYDTFSGTQISEAKYRQYQIQDLVPYCAIEVKECDEHERRRIDLSCNNLHYPTRGATLTPYRRMLPPEFGPNYSMRLSRSGTSLPLARTVRVSVMSDGRKASEELTVLVTNGLLAITGDVTSVHDTANYVAVTTTCCVTGRSDPRCMPVYVPEDDVHLRRSGVRCMNLTRAVTYQDLGCAPKNTPPERVNTSPPMLDLSIIYGNEEPRARQAREGRGGLLRSDVINGKEWPPNGGSQCVMNQRQRGEERCHDTPVAIFNALIGANVLGMWVFRQHNAIARVLADMNPCWDDERIYLEAREINIARSNQMWYYEMMPAILGFEYMLKNKIIFDTVGHIDDYDPTLEPRVSIEYVISTRYFHSMQEGRLKMYNNKGKLLDELKTVEMTLRTGILPLNRTIEGLTQGFFRQGTAANDHLIDPDMGERVLGSLQTASDVMSSDMMKGRDAGLPPYNKYRQACHLPVAKDFDDLKNWMPVEQVEALQLNYESVEDIDIMAGILAESPMEGATVGPVLACVMADQLLHWRRADRFWYENSVHPGAFTPEQLYEIRKVSMARLICDQGDDVDSIQPHAFYLPGPGNEIRDCKYIQTTSLEPWRDQSCIAIKPNTKYSEKPNPFIQTDDSKYDRLGSGKNEYYPGVGSYLGSNWANPGTPQFPNWQIGPNMGQNINIWGYPYVSQYTQGPNIGQPGLPVGPAKQNGQNVPNNGQTSSNNAGKPAGPINSQTGSGMPVTGTKSTPPARQTAPKSPTSP